MTFRKNTSIGQLGGQAAGEGPEDLLRAMVQRLVQEAIQAEFDRFIGAGRFERTATRRGWRNGFKPRTLKTRVGKLVLRIPQDREGRFQPSLFERYQRSEKALMAALIEMYVHGGGKTPALRQEKGSWSFKALVCVARSSTATPRCHVTGSELPPATPPRRARRAARPDRGRPDLRLCQRERGSASRREGVAVAHAVGCPRTRLRRGFGRGRHGSGGAWAYACWFPGSRA